MSADPTERPTPAGQETIVATDATADLTDLDGAPVATPASIDVVRVEASIEGTDLRVTLTLAAPAETGVDSSNGDQINYVVQIDTDQPEGYEFWLAAENRSDGRYSSLLTDWTDGHNYDEENDEYPGTGLVDSTLVMWTVPLSALHDPVAIRISVWTQRTVNFDPIAEDYVPDAASNLSGDASDWLVVLGES